MTSQKADPLRLELGDLEGLSPTGFYLALRVGFAFPVEEVNCLPSDWVQHYTRHGFMLFDPVIRWVYANVGFTRWSAIANDDARGVMGQARAFGLRFGIAVSVFDGNDAGQRSFGTFVRPDREFTDLEAKLLHAYVARRHQEMAPPTNLTKAETEALVMVKDGKRLKEIAHELGVSEGAVKQRLKNAKSKLGAKTSSQAAAIASQHNIV